MAEMIADTESLESTTIGIYRTAAVVKGGRRFSFSAMVAVGDRNGRVGLGYGKAPGVPAAIEKAQKEARKKLSRVNLLGGTIPHPINSRFGASVVKLVPAAPGTGVIAGATVRAVLELAGVRDCLTKSFGSTNQKNLAKAVLAGLEQLRQKEEIAALRQQELEQTEVEERLELGRRYAPESVAEKQEAPKPQPESQSEERGGRGRGRGGRGRGGGGGRDGGRGGRERQTSPGGSGVRATVRDAKPKPAQPQASEEPTASPEGGASEGEVTSEAVQPVEAQTPETTSAATETPTTEAGPAAESTGDESQETKTSE